MSDPVDELIATLRETDPDAHQLRAENRELRRMLGVLVTWIGERENLAGFVHTEMERRWPSRNLRSAAWR